MEQQPLHEQPADTIDLDDYAAVEDWIAAQVNAIELHIEQLRALKARGDDHIASHCLDAMVDTAEDLYALCDDEIIAILDQANQRQTESFQPINELTIASACEAIESMMLEHHADRLIYLLEHHELVLPRTCASHALARLECNKAIPVIRARWERHRGDDFEEYYHAAALVLLGVEEFLPFALKGLYSRHRSGSAQKVIADLLIERACSDEQRREVRSLLEDAARNAVSEGVARMLLRAADSLGE